jgi:hypothetical protein
MALQSILLEVIGAVKANSQLRIAVLYDTSDGDNTLSGIGLGFHYDSSRLTFVGSETVFAENILGEGVYNREDSNNEDRDMSTDRYLSLNYLDTSGNSQWPGGQLPLKLAEFIFETSESFEQTEIKITREPSLSS